MRGTSCTRHYSHFILSVKNKTGGQIELKKIAFACLNDTLLTLNLKAMVEANRKALISLQDSRDSVLNILDSASCLYYDAYLFFTKNNSNYQKKIPIKRFYKDADINVTLN
jgi:hypothetical protein